jgi:hypothetical protein
MSTIRAKNGQSMLLDPKALDTLYSMYGFESLVTGTPDVRAYAFQRGYFHNADIVPLTAGAHTEAVKQDLEQAGYSSRVRAFLSLQAAENALFDGFFATRSSINRLNQEHRKFISRLTSNLGGTYQYIESRYESEDAPKTEASDGGERLIPKIANLLVAPGARLILLEAAAGFGKTCTAYEVLAALLQNGAGKIPILTELSRNRQAKIFRYVLLDEIDRNFPGINSNLVTHYIREGRIPLIIDGFDELLQGSTSTHTPLFEEAEAMLDTIRGLIGGEAKILLTTRRTAILSGDEFHRWLEAHDANFDVHRFRLEPPTPTDWLGSEKVKIAQEKRVPLKQLANPVLLTFLRNLETPSYKEVCQDPSQVVRRYFESLLEREKIRQDLHMEYAEQMEVFRRLAADMLVEDFTTDTREYIHLRIQERNANLFAAVREKYPADAKPTSDELANKLVNHALFDRFGARENLIGFINDFVLGSFAGDVLIESSKGDWIGSERLADLAATSFAARSQDERMKLWHALSAMFEFFEPNVSIGIDVNLMGKVAHAHNAAAISGHVFEGVEFAHGGVLTNCVVTNCRFVRSTIFIDSLSGCTFVNCDFFECRFVDRAVEELNSEEQEPGSAEPEVIVQFLACTGDASFADFLREAERLAELQNQMLESDDWSPAEQAVLERFWPPGRSHFTERKAIRTLYLGLSGSREERIQMTQAIKRLEKRGLIFLVRDYANLNTGRIGDVRRVLGREP